MYESFFFFFFIISHCIRLTGELEFGPDGVAKGPASGRGGFYSLLSTLRIALRRSAVVVYLY